MRIERLAVTCCLFLVALASAADTQKFYVREYRLSGSKLLNGAEVGEAV